MATDKVKVGVVGAGKMGALHLEKYLEMEQVEVVGVFEPNHERAMFIHSRYGVPRIDTLVELLFEADAISIASPTGTHFDIARQAFDARVDVLVEKPICERVTEAERLVAMARQSGCLLQVGFVERFRFQELSKGIPSLGPARFIETHRLSPSLGRDTGIDVISDLMIHDLDLLLSIVGELPNHVSAIAVPVLTSHYDIANARLEFPSGAVANLNASRVSAKMERKLRIFSLDSYASMDFISNEVNLYFKNSKRELESRTFKNEQVDALQRQCSTFIQCVKSRQNPLVGGDDGLAALRVLEAIKQKVEERAAWNIPNSVLTSPLEKVEAPQRDA